MRNLRILVAEDEVVVCLSIVSELEESGYTVVGEAGDGAEAIELCRELQPDLVIMDINMPRMNGIEAARFIHENFRIPVVILTAYSDEKLIAEATEAGVFNYLVKPVTKENLIPAIQVALKKHGDYSRMEEESKKLRESLENRKLIERAKGILMKRSHLSEPDAMRKLQKMSNESNKRLVDVAREVIAAEELFS